MKTKVTDLLDIQYPIIQGDGLGGRASSGEAAVSEAGGFGDIKEQPMHRHSGCREQIRLAKKTDKPFGVNVMLMRALMQMRVAQVIAEGCKAVTTVPEIRKNIWRCGEKAGIRVIPVVAPLWLWQNVMEAVWGEDAVVAEGCESGGHVGGQPPWHWCPR